MAANIFTSGEFPNDVATTWLTQYEADNTTSMADLINCILKCTGCELKITEDDVNDPDNIPSKLNEMQDEYRDVCIPVSYMRYLNSREASKISQIIH